MKTSVGVVVLGMGVHFPSEAVLEPSLVQQARHIDGSFDLRAEKVAAGFQGHDLRRIYDWAATWSYLRRGEFETSHEFNDRVQKGKSSMAYGSVGVNSLLAFRIWFRPEYEQVKYDADRESFTVSIALVHYETRSGLLSPHTVVFPTHTVIDQGAQTLGPTRWKHYEVSIANAEAFVSKVTRSRIEMNLPVPREKARELKDRLQVLLIGNLSGPEGTTGNARVAMFQSYLTVFGPRGIATRLEGREHYVTFIEMVSIWVFDSRTGDVLLKVSPRKGDANEG